MGRGFHRLLDGFYTLVVYMNKNACTYELEKVYFYRFSQWRLNVLHAKLHKMSAQNPSKELKVLLQ